MHRLNIEREASLRAYLQSQGRITPNERLGVRVLAGGVSNRTVLVRRESGESWVLKQPLARLRVQADWFSSVQRIHREALGLRVLEQMVPAGRVPRFVFEDRQHHVLAMEAVPDPHENWKTLLLAGQVAAEHFEQFAQLLATIHRGGWARREEISAPFADCSFFESLRLKAYYAYTAERVPESAGFLDGLIERTRSRCITLVHGDYSPKNILVHQGRLVLLDHEVMHFGDPAFDLGFSMAHLLSKAHHLAGERSAFEEAAGQYWSSYRDSTVGESWAEDLEVHAVQHTLACLLARVAGKSILEYFDESTRIRQQSIVLRLWRAPPQTVAELIHEFVEQLG